MLHRYWFIQASIVQCNKWIMNNEICAVLFWFSLNFIVSACINHAKFQFYMSSSISQSYDSAYSSVSYDAIKQIIQTFINSLNSFQQNHNETLLSLDLFTHFQWIIWEILNEWKWLMKSMMITIMMITTIIFPDFVTAQAELELFWQTFWFSPFSTHFATQNTQKHIKQRVN